MKIFVNDEGVELSAGAMVVDVVATTVGDGAAAGVAVAVNGQVVRRTDWATTTLFDDDRVEVLRATAGG